MPPEPPGDRPPFRRSAWRGLLAITATYVAFLLFAQFGFLRQVQNDLAQDVERVRAVMAAMGIAGLAASLGTAGLLGRHPALRLVRLGLAAVAAVAAVSVVCHGFGALLGIAAAIGASIGLLTVALATALPDLAPRHALGRTAGLGTGIAYFVSNVPVLFEAVPQVRALFPAGLAILALALLSSQRPLALEEAETAERRAPGLAGLVVIFLVLVWLDSAAFAIVQANPALKAQTWGSAAQTLLQGSIHLVAAVGAGALLDAGFALAVPLAAWVLFALAFPLLQAGGPAAVLAGPLYAVGISLYSTALVVLPTWGTVTAPAPRWRAGLLYGLAGWIGSALGVGMAQDLGRIPGWFLLATGAALAAVLLPRLFRKGGGALSRFAGEGRGGGLAVATCGLLGVMLQALTSVPSREQIEQGGTAAAELRGRRVYIQEGCIHCHSQYVRAASHDETWWGPAQPLDRAEAPVLLGTRRQGPDLLQVGNRRSAVWHEIHLRDPRALNPGSRMPSYAHLFAGDGQRGGDLVAYLMSLGASTGVERWERTRTAPLAPPPLPPSTERGAALFAAYCAACHGPDGRGDGRFAGPVNDPWMNLRKAGLHALSPDVAARPEARREALARILRFGLPPTSMPGHEWLTDQQIADLAAWVDTLPTPPETP